MNRRLRAGLLLTLLLLSGCSRTEEMTVLTPDEDLQAAACLGTYPESGNMDAVIARMGEETLTNRELQVWYGAEIAQYLRQTADTGPDIPRMQDPCPFTDNACSWQQYFLDAAVNRWHTANALILHSREVPLPTEEAYKGDQSLLVKYMSEMPATKLLYGYDPYYRPNTLHQRFLEDLEERLTGPELDMARTLNYGYMYFTTLSYDLEPEDPGTEAEEEARVRFRQILLRPEEGEESCTQRAIDLLNTWQKGKKPSESTFAQLASQNSLDTSSAKSGGLYANVSRDQLPGVISQWSFDENRQQGDTALIPMEDGIHILYFVSLETGTDLRQAQRQQAQRALLAQIRELYPMETDYDAVVLKEVTDGPSVSELLYPDIAHERFPEVPLYLQQNYQGTMYGEYKLTTNGCGITSLAMLASYLCDEEFTPPELSALYGRYSRPTGTAASLFDEVPPQLGFYLLKKTYDWREARDYMEEGYSVIVCQHKGYWTGGGHYLVLETLTEEGLVQVRDSNLYNYRKLPRHKDDAFPWVTLQSGGKGYWIYEKKVTSTEACVRCGHPETLESPLVRDYLCETCRKALCRRNAYLDCSL